MRPLVEKGKTLSELRRLRRLFSIRHHICVPVTPRSEPKQPGFDGLGIVARPGLLSGEDRPNLPAGRFARGDNGGRWKPEQTKEEVSLMRMFRVVALSAFVAVPVVAQAQGVPGGINYGAHRGAYTGYSVLGPVGGVVGGVVGGAAGGVVGGVNGVFGIYPHKYHRRYYRR
jgi:hypothetical protein